MLFEFPAHPAPVPDADSIPAEFPSLQMKMATHSGSHFHLLVGRRLLNSYAKPA
jgi:hypothetical protein